MAKAKNEFFKKIRILVAEDHAVVREGTVGVLERESDFEVVGEAGDGKEAVRLACELLPDIALVDIVMPEMNGVEVTRQIKQLCPSVAVLILSAYDDDQFVFSLLEAGAAGYLLKSVHGHEVIAAIRAVIEGEPVLHPAIARKVMGHFTSGAGVTASKPKPSNRLMQLSPREAEIFMMAVRGVSNRDIATQLAISVRTVQAHFTSVFKKLQVSSRTEAMLLGLKEGWLNLDEVKLSND